MIVAVCVDDNMGMLFNGRRQSQDREVRRRLLEEAGGPLWMNAYSAGQFAGMEDKIRVDEAFLDKAGPGEWCFAEGTFAAEKLARIEKIVLFKWNRVYPADVYFDKLPEGWKLAETGGFKGRSHELITKEVYIK